MSVGFRSAIVLCFDRLFSWVLLCMQCAENLESYAARELCASIMSGKY